MPAARTAPLPPAAHPADHPADPAADAAAGERVDPVEQHPDFHETDTRVAVAGHPVHAMLVTFPIALAACTLAADGLYWWTGDTFWARGALWACGTAFLVGVLAGLVGTAELLLVPGIRRRSASWTHFVLAVMLLSLIGANWGLRLGGYEQAVLPWGILLSALALVFTGFTGWHGGKLVFEYQIGVSSTGS